MELLVGKAKEGFKLWFSIKNKEKTFSYNEKYLNNLDDIFLNALIIEWLDSVGINVACQWFDKDWIFSVEVKPFKQHHYRDFGFASRQEATNEAIKKSVEIYNQTK